MVYIVTIEFQLCVLIQLHYHNIYVRADEKVILVTCQSAWFISPLGGNGLRPCTTRLSCLLPKTYRACLALQYLGFVTLTCSYVSFVLLIVVFLLLCGRFSRLCMGRRKRFSLSYLPGKRVLQTLNRSCLDILETLYTYSDRRFPVRLTCIGGLSTQLMRCNRWMCVALRCRHDNAPQQYGYSITCTRARNFRLMRHCRGGNSQSHAGDSTVLLRHELCTCM